MRKYLSENDILSEINFSLKSALGRSYIRLGDAESRILMWDENTITKEIKWLLNTIMGFEGDIDLYLLRKFRKDIISALSTVDGLFLFESSADTPYNQHIMAMRKFIDFNLFPSHLISNISVINNTFNDNFISTLIANSSKTHLITCRENAVDVLNKKLLCNISQDNVILIPSEKKFRNMYSERHDSILVSQYPNLMMNIRKSVIPSNIQAGEVVLIGAGVPKILYAEVIKSLGGIAYDVGHYFDLLCGYKTRGIYSTLKS